MKNTLFLICITILFCSCNSKIEKASNIDEEFFIPVKESNLFVRMIGNPNNPLIIDLHGGPGGDSGFTHEIYRNHLEDDYFIAYLDQRGCGKSDDVKDKSLLTMKQYIEDLDAVVDTLKNKYKNPKINLLGSSWGGTYGLLYLINHQEKITSFICSSGLADALSSIYAIIEHETKLANELLEKTNDDEEKIRYKEILDKLTEIKNSDFENFYEDVHLLKFKFPSELGFNPYMHNMEALEKVKKMRKDSMVFKRANYTIESATKSMEKGEIVNEEFRNTAAYNRLNLLDDISVIKTPTLVIQGEYDYVIGLKQAQKIYNALTNVPESDKKLHIIPNAAHNLTIEATNVYFESVNSFLDKYNE